MLGNLVDSGAGGAPVADLKHHEAERERQTDFRNKCLMIVRSKEYDVERDERYKKGGVDVLRCVSDLFIQTTFKDLHPSQR